MSEDLIANFTACLRLRAFVIQLQLCNQREEKTTLVDLTTLEPDGLDFSDARQPHVRLD